MAKQPAKKRLAKSPPPAAQPEPAVVPAVRSYKDAAAEDAFRDLPGRVDETLAVVRYTGRKRIYIHFGSAGGDAFSYLIFSDGHRSLAVYPPQRREECFADLLRMVDGWLGSVNSDPMSDSYCDVCPAPDTIRMIVATRYLAPEAS